LCIVVHITCKISRFQDGGSLNNYITIFLPKGIWKVHIFHHLFVCFQTSVYTLGEFHKNRNNSTVLEELKVSIVDLTVANAVGYLWPSNPQLSPTTLQIQYCYSYSDEILPTCTLVWKHTNKWRNICTFQIPSAKKNNLSNPWLTPTTLQIQYCYSYSYEILPTCTH
jgi:hypothetical protein